MLSLEGESEGWGEGEVVIGKRCRLRVGGVYCYGARRLGNSYVAFFFLFFFCFFVCFFGHGGMDRNYNTPHCTRTRTHTRNQDSTQLGPLKFPQIEMTLVCPDSPSSLLSLSSTTPLPLFPPPRSIRTSKHLQNSHPIPHHPSTHIYPSLPTSSIHPFLLLLLCPDHTTGTVGWVGYHGKCRAG